VTDGGTGAAEHERRHERPRKRVQTGTEESAVEQERGSFLPVPAGFQTFCATFVTVRSVKFCAHTAHSRVTEKYDGGAAHTARGRHWEAA